MAVHQEHIPVGYGAATIHCQLTDEQRTNIPVHFRGREVGKKKSGATREKESARGPHSQHEADVGSCHCMQPKNMLCCFRRQKTPATHNRARADSR